MRALKNKHAGDVAYHLIDIYNIFVAPRLIQSDNGHKISKQVEKEASAKELDLKVVHGNPGHNHTQCSVKRAKLDVENMLCS